MHRIRLMAAGTVAALLGACASSGVTREAPPIDVADLDLRQEIRFLNIKDRERFLSDPAELQKLLETLYFRRRMTQLADDFGAQDDAQLQALLRRDREYRFADWVPRRFLETLEVPDLTDEARAYYEANPQEFTPKEALHLQSIFLQATDAKARSKRRSEAAELRVQLRAGADFGELAEQHSEDAGRHLRGDIGNNIMRGEMPAEVESAAFALAEVGEISDVIESPYGFHILKLLGRRAPTVLPFEQVRERILDDLQAKYRDRAVREWMDRVSPESASQVDPQTLERMAQALREEFGVTAAPVADGP
jgi:peptidyl-prolyl cis-trans isomerase C